MSSRQGHIKRPMNSFMVWSREKRCEILKCNPGMSNALISKKLGSTWKSLSEEEKKPYVDEAKRLTNQHKQDYPDYKYRPRRHAKSKMKSSVATNNIRSPSSPTVCGKSELSFPPEWNMSSAKSALAVKQPSQIQPIINYHYDHPPSLSRPNSLFLPENDASRYYVAYPSRTPYSPRLFPPTSHQNPPSHLVCMSDIFNPFRHVASEAVPSLYMGEFHSSPEKWAYVHSAYENPMEATRFICNGQVR